MYVDTIGKCYLVHFFLLEVIKHSFIRQRLLYVSISEINYWVAILEIYLSSAIVVNQLFTTVRI